MLVAIKLYCVKACFTFKTFIFVCLFQTFKVPLPVGDAQSLPVVKPLGRSSNLPRPVNTGIPRPVSRIPGPRAVK